MPEAADVKLAERYDTAASRWRDKMRALGYYDAYLGFLSEPDAQPLGGRSVIDVGAGTAAFSEAWIAVHGKPTQMTLLDPSARMLKHGARAIRRFGVDVHQVSGMLGQSLEPADEVLAAHVLEHCPDPLAALRQLRALLRPGGRLRLVVSRPHWCNVIIWFKWRHRTFTSDGMRALLKEANLRLKFEYAFPSGPPSRTSRGYVATLM